MEKGAITHMARYVHDTNCNKREGKQNEEHKYKNFYKNIFIIYNIENIFSPTNVIPNKTNRKKSW